jgi:predicted RNA-binding Zn-ribbon protein involved in translation (DUF1610 family)
MTTPSPKGVTYRCPVCGAEVAVIARRHGAFAPRCCNTAMLPIRRRLVFFICPVCGSEVAVMRGEAGNFTPRCCNVAMRREAA